MKFTLCYIGQRFWPGDKIVQVFIDAKNKESAFTKIRFCIIGQYYFASREGDKISMSRIPDDASGPDPSPDDIKKWEAQDLLAVNMTKRKRLANKFKRDKRIEREVIPHLQKVCKGLDYIDTRELITVLVNRALKKEDLS